MVRSQRSILGVPKGRRLVWFPPVALLVAAVVLIVVAGIARLDPTVPTWARAAGMVLAVMVVAAGTVYTLAVV